jgi:autotransporter passenger strand-loop-strand repeat protein
VSDGGTENVFSGGTTIGTVLAGAMENILSGGIALRPDVRLG